jgi:hypothetical protein
VYLIREQRRLQAIADAVQAEDAEQAVRATDPSRLVGLAALRRSQHEEDE